MTPANDLPYSVDIDRLEAELATMSVADLPTAAIYAWPENLASEVIEGEAERRGIDL
jgi:hypothetical protein